MNYIYRFIALFVILIGSLAMGELAIRIWFSYSQNYDIEMWKYAQRLKKSVPDGRGHIHRPNAQAKLMGTHVRINELGWRDREVNPSDLTAEYRILFAGDSICFGWGVDEDHRFSNLFQKWLRKTRKLETATVFNGGVGNYNSRQVLHFLQEQAHILKPTEVIYAFFINDLEPEQTNQYGFILSHCMLFATLKSVLARFIGHRKVQGNYFDYYSGLFDNTENLARFKNDMAQMKRLSNNLEGFRLTVLLIPDLHQLEPYPFQSNYQHIKAILDEQGIRYIDALAGFDKSIPPRQYWVASDDAHPNKLANQAIFKALADGYQSDR